MVNNLTYRLTKIRIYISPLFILAYLTSLMQTDFCSDASICQHYATFHNRDSISNFLQSCFLHFLSFLIKEFVMRIPSLEDNVMNVVHTGKDDPTVGLVNILSYDLLPKHLETLRRKHFRIVIAVSFSTGFLILLISKWVLLFQLQW